ncbi:MAG: hypothetical protein WD626_05835 [Bauldia sp.]
MNSHIIPAFVFRWSKETSITGYLRNGENPRRRLQDGLKVPLLCSSCEGMLNEWETRFATEIFHPYNANSSLRAAYGDWMLKFCVSVSWRVLKYMADKHPLDDWSEQQRAAAVGALERWRAFMFGEVPHPGPYEQNLLPLSVMSSSTIPNMPTNMNRYLARGLDMDVAHGERTAFTYSKMGKLALFGMVVPSAARWRGARVSVRSGVIQPGHFEVPHHLADYLMDRARGSAKLQQMIPERQNEKIEEVFMRDLDRVANTDQFKAMLADAEMFGVDAVIRKPSGE